MLNLREKALRLLNRLSESDRAELKQAIEDGTTCFLDCAPELYHKEFIRELSEMLEV